MSTNNKHSIFTVYHDSLGLSVYNCGFQKCEPDFSWGPALRNHHIIHFVASGKGKYIKGGQEYELSVGDGFYCPPDEVLYYVSDSNEPWEYYWIGFGGVDAYWLLGAAGLSSKEPIFHCKDTQSIIKAFLDVYNSYGSELYNEIEMSGNLYKCLSSIIKESDSIVGKHRRSTDYIDISIRFIEHNYSRPISVNDIASSTGISRSHLYRLFMQELNITPNEYLIQFRISNACKLLRESNINISEAAYSSGFSDPLYFSRVFKRIKGITPTEYANNNQKK